MLASGPNARFADSGAVFAEGGLLTLTDSVVNGNRAVLEAQLPNSVDVAAVAGAVHISDQASGTIRDTTISGNLVKVTNSVGDANAASGGLHSDSVLMISNVIETNNSVRVATVGASNGNAAADSGAGEMQGSMSNVQMTGNSVVSYSVAGDAEADSGGSVYEGVLTNSLVRGNWTRAIAPHGTAQTWSGGVTAAGPLTLRNTVIDGNTIYADGTSGSAHGGGMLAGDRIALVNSRVTHNAASAPAGFTVQGGGIFALSTVTLTNSVISGNSPDQCVGC